MKNLAAIVFLTIIGLSVTSQAWEQTGKDMLQICQTTHSGCDDGCCTDYCSPFHICSHCHGFTFSWTQVDCSEIAFLEIALFPYLQPHSSLFCGDIWQPPRIS